MLSGCGVSWKLEPISFSSSKHNLEGRSAMFDSEATLSCQHERSYLESSTQFTISISAMVSDDELQLINENLAASLSIKLRTRLPFQDAPKSSFARRTG